MAGKVTTGAYPFNCVFHPLLRLGAAYAQHSNHLVFFDAKSFVERRALNLGKGPQPTAVMTFGDHGRKLYCASETGIRYIPLELSAEDEALLKHGPSAPAAAPGEKPVYPKRTWADATGKFHIEGRFGGLEDGKVILIKDDGGRSLVPLERLSDADRSYVGTLRSPGG